MMRLAGAAASLLLLLAAPAGAQQPFRWDGAATVTLSATGTTSRVQVQAAEGGTQAVRLYNAGTVPVFVACGAALVVATVAAGLPVAPGSVEVLGCNQPYIAGITAGTAATVYVTAGTGL